MGLNAALENFQHLLAPGGGGISMPIRGPFLMLFDPPLQKNITLSLLCRSGRRFSKAFGTLRTERSAERSLNFASGLSRVENDSWTQNRNRFLFNKKYGRIEETSKIHLQFFGSPGIECSKRYKRPSVFTPV
jgi:hypothetical protein